MKLLLTSARITNDGIRKALAFPAILNMLRNASDRFSFDMGRATHPNLKAVLQGWEHDFGLDWNVRSSRWKGV